MPPVRVGGIRARQAAVGDTHDSNHPHSHSAAHSDARNRPPRLVYAPGRTPAPSSNAVSSTGISRSVERAPLPATSAASLWIQPARGTPRQRLDLDDHACRLGKRRTGKCVTQVAWETRRGGTHRYYTQSVRRGGRVVRVYVGTGPHAEAVAAADRERRVNLDARRAATRLTLGPIAEADAKVRALYDAAETAASAALLSAGYHRHDRGPWRRRRA